MKDRLLSPFPFPPQVFVKMSCPYCVRVLQVLDDVTDRNHMHIVDLNRDPDGWEMQSVLGQMTGARTMPRVFVGGQVRLLLLALLLVAAHRTRKTR